MTDREKFNETLSVQELIDILMSAEDKSAKVLVEAFPEVDNCATYIPITKDRINVDGKHFIESDIVPMTLIDCIWYDDDEYSDEEDD